MSIPREAIPWYPTIEGERPTNCGLCVDFCTHRVYRVDDIRTVVTAPFRGERKGEILYRLRGDGSVT